MPAKPTPAGHIPYVLVPNPKQKKRVATSTPNSSTPSPSKRARYRSLSASETGPVLYDQTRDKVTEDKDLAVPGEIPVDDGVKDGASESTVPVRLLGDFDIYDSKTGLLINIEKLLPGANSHEGVMSHNAEASGLVSALTLDHDEVEDASNGSNGATQRVKLTKILDFNIHHVDDDKHSEDPLDQKIYIRTEYAWYILGLPSAQYRRYYMEFRLKHWLLTDIVQYAYVNRYTSPTFDEYVEFFNNRSGGDLQLSELEEIIQRHAKVEDFCDQGVRDYLLEWLPKLCREKALSLKKLPIMQEILNRDYVRDDPDAYEASELDSEASGLHQNNTRHPHQPRRRKADAYLTPIVHRIAEELMGDHHLDVVEMDTDPNNTTLHKPSKRHPEHQTNPDSIILKDLYEDDTRYASAEVDGALYQAGDAVMVLPDPYEKVHPESRTPNKYGDTMWFCRIQYFMEDNQGQKCFHAQWFTHGCRTILQQISHSQALYLLDSCDTMPVSCIVQKVNVDMLKAHELEEEDSRVQDNVHFHCALVYDVLTTSFTSLPPIFTSGTMPECAFCLSCEKGNLDDHSDQPRLRNDALTYHNQVHHRHDFVYLLSGPDTPLEIGQIIRLDGGNGKRSENIRVEVRVFERRSRKARANELGKEGYFNDERELVRTDTIRNISCTEIDGKCWVKHIPVPDEKAIADWVRRDDHFFFNKKYDSHSQNVETLTPPFPIHYCKDCNKKDQEEYREERKFFNTTEPLVGMELFSGAGGLSMGLGFSQVVKTKYAVEFDRSAAKTHRENHPDITVYCQDTNLLLKSAVEGTPIPTLDNVDCGPMPKKNDTIDIIFGGPPCQSFSRMNHAKRPDDVRSLLPLNMLSYAEHYDPDYFLLENVSGMLEHRLPLRERNEDGEFTDKTSLVERGMVKLIVRTLIALGYQVRFQQLQAAQYGVPQSRRRVIFWAAKRGLQLPNFPKPTHCYNGPKANINIAGKVKPPEYRSRHLSSGAPFPAVTIDDAISDLPEFEWENPHRVFVQLPSERDEALRRKKMGIKCFNATFTDSVDNPGFTKGVAYSREPRNRFQAFLRRNMNAKGKTKLTLHYTPLFSARKVEIVVNIPLSAGACHTLLYGRPGGHELFRCALTTMDPGSKGSQWVLHPTQKRTFSVRECARMQGFPDDYEFCSVSDKPSRRIRDQLRQIGNAVPVPLGLALGRELGRALFRDWKEKRMAPSPEL